MLRQPTAAEAITLDTALNVVNIESSLVHDSQQIVDNLCVRCFYESLRFTICV